MLVNHTDHGSIYMYIYLFHTYSGIGTIWGNLAQIPGTYEK